MEEQTTAHLGSLILPVNCPFATSYVGSLFSPGRGPSSWGKGSRFQAEDILPHLVISVKLGCGYLKKQHPKCGNYYQQMNG